MTGADTLEYEARMEDSVVYTRPWMLRTVLYRVKQSGARIIEDEVWRMQTAFDTMLRQPMLATC